MTAPAIRLLTPRQTAAFMRISQATLLRWRSQGYGPPFLRLGDRLIRYDLRGVEAWVASTQSNLRDMEGDDAFGGNGHEE